MLIRSQRINFLTFKYSTGKTVPSIAVVIEDMDNLDNFLANRVVDRNIPQSLRLGINKAKDITNKWYNKTDDHALYSIAVCERLSCSSTTIVNDTSKYSIHTTEWPT